MTPGIREVLLDTDEVGIGTKLLLEMSDRTWETAQYVCRASDIGGWTPEADRDYARALQVTRNTSAPNYDLLVTGADSVLVYATPRRTEYQQIGTLDGVEVVGSVQRVKFHRLLGAAGSFRETSPDGDDSYRAYYDRGTEVADVPE